MFLTLYVEYFVCSSKGQIHVHSDIVCGVLAGNGSQLCFSVIEI